MEKDTVISMARKLNEAIKGKRVEIERAISVLKESHGLTFCQVWIPRTINNEKQARVVKLVGGYTADFKDYYDACVKIEDGLDELAVKALGTYEAYFSINIDAKGDLHRLLPTVESGCCCLGICLRNIETGDLDYAFEFLFSSYANKNNHNNNNNPCVFLESLFVKLETCLPGFKFSSGAQLGRELLVIDVDNNPEQSFNILAWKKQEEELEDRQELLLRRSTNIMFGNLINRATVEIQEAISILKESHGLTLCQVWIYPYTINKNEKGAMKLDGYCDAAFKDYFDACVEIQDGAGILALRALITNQPYFSKNINNIVKTGKPHALLLPVETAKTICCFAVPLRYIYTGGLEYAFEFFFSLPDNNNNNNNNDPCVFLESLLVTLETCFPNFKLSSGAQLGRQLQILDGDNLAASFEFLAFIKLQEEEEKEDEADDFMEDVEQQQSETSSPNAKNYLCFSSSSDKNGPSSIRIRTIDVSASMKFADLKMKICHKFDLVSTADYRLSYLANGSNRKLWIQLKGDRGLNRCISFCTRKRIRRLVMRVSPFAISLNSRSQPQESSQIN